MPKSGITAKLVSSSRWNFIAFAIAVAANFVVIPLVIASIGLDAFGAAGLVLAVYAPFTLVGTVIGQALVKELAPRLANGDKDGCIRFASAALVLSGVCATAVVFLLYLVGNEILLLMVKDKANWSWPIFVFGLGWMAQQACILIQATIAATQNFGRLAIAGSISAVLSAAAVVISSNMMPNALGFLIGTSVGYGITLLVHSISLWRNLGWLIEFRKWHPDNLSELMLFAKWQGAAHFAGAIGNQVDRYALGVLAPLQVVGQYNVAMRLQEVVHMGVLKISEVLFPHFSVTADDPLDKQAHFFVRSNWLNNLVAVIALAPLIPLAESIITLWVNASAAEIAAPILRTLAFAGVIGAGSSVYTYQAMAKGKSSRLARINATHASLLVTLTITFIWFVGPLAAGAGCLFANIFRLIIVTRFSKSDFSPVLSMSAILVYAMPPLLGGLALAWLLLEIQPHWGSTWPELMINYVLIAATIAAAALMSTALFKQGREQLQESYVWISKTLLHNH